jgi:organic hydroperoxide reductase OsmC/OhrA
MAETHVFEGRIEWQAGGEGAEVTNHTVTFEGRPALALSSAPAYAGDASRLNPEELLTAAVGSCLMLTFLALARRRGLDVRAWEDTPAGTLAMADKRMRITEVHLRPHITIGPDVDAALIEALVAAAHRGCFISNSVSCAVVIEPTVTRAA